MTAHVGEFIVGELYSNDAIGQSLGVGNAGGIRPNLNDDGSIRRLVLLTAVPSVKLSGENPYMIESKATSLFTRVKGCGAIRNPVA